MDEPENFACEPLEIPSLIREVENCIQTLKQSWSCRYRTEYENVVKRGRHQVLSIIKKIKDHDHCQQPALATKEELKRNIFYAKMECEFKETKIAHLRREWTKQQESMGKLQESYFKKCRLLSLHSSYCSTQGSALCSILAVLMERKDSVHIFLADADSYIKDFIKIADGCLFSFIRTYASDAPLEDSPDYKFILALWACIASISVVPDGRIYLIEHEESQKALSSVTYVLPRIRHITAERLVLILWKTLYNVSTEEKGKLFLQHCSEMPSTLNNYILRKYHPQIHAYALETLEQISQNIVSKDFLDQLMNLNGVQRLKELSGFMYPEVKHIPKKILNSVTKAAERFLKLEKEQAAQRAERRLFPCGSKQARPSSAVSEPYLKTMTRQTIQVPPESGPGRVRTIQRFKPMESQQSSGFKSEYQQTGSSPLCSQPCKELFHQASSLLRDDNESSHVPCPQHGTEYATQRFASSTLTSSSGYSVYAPDSLHTDKKKGLTSSSRSMKMRVSYKESDISAHRSYTKITTSASKEKPSTENKRHCGSKRCKGPSKPVHLLPCYVHPTFTGFTSSQCLSTNELLKHTFAKRRPWSSPVDSFRPLREEISRQVLEDDCTKPVKDDVGCQTEEKKSFIPVPISGKQSQRAEDSSLQRLFKSQADSANTRNSKQMTSSRSKSSAIPIYKTRKRSRDISESSNKRKTSQESAPKKSFRLKEYKTVIPVPSEALLTSSSSNFTRKFSPLNSQSKQTICRGYYRDYQKSISGSLVKVNSKSQNSSSVPTCVLLLEHPEVSPSIVHGGVYYYDRQTDSNEEISATSDQEKEEQRDRMGASISDRKLLLWDPRERSLVRLDERDDRFSGPARTMRIFSQVQNKTNKPHQKVVTRIRIPKMPFNAMPFNPEF